MVLFDGMLLMPCFKAVSEYVSCTRSKCGDRYIAFASGLMEMFFLALAFIAAVLWRKQ
jgi:hypothetical protein